MKLKTIRQGAIGMRHLMEPLSDRKAGEVRGFGSSLWLMSLQDGVVKRSSSLWSRVHWCRENGTLAFGCEIKLFLIWT